MKSFTEPLMSPFIESQELGIRAVRDGAGGYVEVRLPCGQKRVIRRIALDEIVARLGRAATWLRPSSDAKDF